MATLSDANFTGLRASLGDWLHRSDLTNTDLGNFIYLFESDFNTQMRNRQMEAQTSVNVTSSYIINPSDWLQWRSITLVQAGQSFALQPLNQENSSVIYGNSYLDQPRGYVVTGDRTYVYPGPNSSQYTYNTVYYQGVPALSASNTTNWLLTAYPSVYLQGSMYWASDYLVDDSKQQKYQMLINDTLNKVRIASDRSKYSGAIPTLRPDSYY